MPKVYSDNEKLLIKKRLHDAANKSLLENGVRKTTVDELVQKVGIAKGTFYLFYKSKELLYMAYEVTSLDFCFILLTDLW